MATVNTGARLDRLPIAAFHYRIFFLIAAGMFFDGYDLYIQAPVVGATVQSHFATLDTARCSGATVCRACSG